MRKQGLLTLTTLAAVSFATAGCKPEFQEVVYTTLVGGNCQKVASLRRVVAEPGKSVSWLVISGCGKTVDVGIGDFAPGATESCKASEPEAPCPNPAELTRRVGDLDIKYITCKVPKNQPEGCWTYKVSVDGQPGPDPELQVRRPF